MSLATSFEYAPALRLKAGEYRALDHLAPDVADRTAPRLVIPPPTQRDPEEGRILTKEEVLHKSGQRVGQHWPSRTSFLDARFLFKTFGEDECEDWLPKIFRSARHFGALPVPVVTLDDLVSERVKAFEKAIDSSAPLKLAVHISSSEVDSELPKRVSAGLSSIGVRALECAALLDLHDADLSDPTAVSEFIGAAHDRIEASERWRRIVFQGTNFPEKNPATSGSKVSVPRTEWLAWKTLVQNDDGIAERLIFGDYGADNAKFEFGVGGGGLPIKHVRYCLEDQWLVVRGLDGATYKTAMKDVCERILSSGGYAGQDFSYADHLIFQMAKGDAGPGNPMTWRMINTVRHITQVVSDLGGFRGYKIARRRIDEPALQGQLI